MTVYCPWKYGIGMISEDGVVIKPDGEFWDMSAEEKETVLNYAKFLCRYVDDLNCFDHMRFYSIKTIANDQPRIIEALQRIHENIFLSVDELDRLHDTYIQVQDYIAERDYKHKTRRAPIAKHRYEIIERDNSTCRYCGKVLRIKEIHIDHVVPYSRGGETVSENLVVACATCNLSKHDRTPKEAGMELLLNEN